MTDTSVPQGTATRELLLVGSVPLRPATRVFETLAERLGGLLPRVPDGDQHGWVMAAVQSFFENPALEQHRRVELSPGGITVPIFRLKDGVDPADVVLGPYGFAEEAIASYQEFKRLRAEGLFAEGVRFQVTMPGPGTSAYFVELPPDILLPLAREALDREIQGLLAGIPADDLAIQLDVAMEAEHEEWRRRPSDFETPIHEVFDWTLEQMADSVAWLADRVPEEVELGFHICTVWHHYQEAGQDNATVVDEINAIASRVSRRIDYLHMPTIPEHDVEDFAPLRDLQLDPATTFYLGVIHAEDGLEGALRRIEAAKTARSDFGVASFCGLGIPAIAAGGQSTTGGMDVGDRYRQGATVKSLKGAARQDPLLDLLDLHRAVAHAGH
jgi:hypothetical protein